MMPFLPFERSMVPFLVALVLALSPLMPSSASAAPATPVLQIDGPQEVNPNEPITLTLSVRHGHDVAAFESSVLFDPSVAEFANMEVNTNAVHSLGRDVGQLTAVETPYGAAIGFYSCPVSNCVDNQSPRRARGANGTVRLGTVTLIGNTTGALAITFDAAKLVDANGNSIPLSVPNPTFFVQVGSAPGNGGSPNRPAFPSPNGRWKLPHVGRGALRPFSTTGSGMVGNADVMEVAMAWQNLRTRGNPCGPEVDPDLDINQDGCIDVADVETVAANYGPTNTSRIEPPTNDVADQTATLQSVTAQAASSTYVVNSTGDEDDVKKGDGVCLTSAGSCTLRAAIAEANNTSGPNTINFNLPGSGVRTIHVNSQLHTLWDTTGPTTIDGYTQPGASPNTAPLADNAAIRVQIEGGGYDQYDGLAITSSNNVIRGLAFYAFHRPLWIYGKGANGNVIVGNFIGTDAGGTARATATGDGEAHGIKIEQGASRNIIGRPNPADRNVISGNARSAVGIWHNGSNSEVVQNNIIGLSPDGTRRLANQLHGIDMNYGTEGNVIGGTGQFEHNVTSGNNFSGIDVSHTPSTMLNKIVGNFIGTDLTGTRSPSYTYNFRFGIRVKDGVTFNTITDNVIGGMDNHATDGNGNVGIEILDSTTRRNTFARNRIGVSLDGTVIPNGVGIAVFGTDNTIGPDNIIAGNHGPGIEIESGATGNTITKNSIFGNTGLGIKLESGANNNIGAPTISGVTLSTVSGSACAGCIIEAFIADGGTGAPGEGKTFVGSGSANASGAFSVSISGVKSGDQITATATDASGDTSQFAANVSVGGTAAPAIALPGHFEIEDYRAGGEGVGYHDTTGGNTGGAYRQDDVDIQTCPDPTTPSGQTCFNVGWTAAGEWLAYNVAVSTAGNYTFAIRVASVNSGKSLHLELDGTTISGSIALPNTGGWQTWKTVTTGPITLPAGNHTLRFVLDTGGCNLNYADVAASP